MIDVGRKRVTRRRAIATGTIHVGEKVFALIRERALPKGDVLALAEAAGIVGAKRAPDLLLMCHPLPLDQVTVHTVLEAPDTVRVTSQVAAHARTGVEMEAIMAVQAGLATIWDLSKGTEPNLTIGGVRLLLKEGGKGGRWLSPDGVPEWITAQLEPERALGGIDALVIVASDRAARGEYEDRSGPRLAALLSDAGASVSGPRVVIDDRAAIEALLLDSGAPLVIVSGGTGAGPRDVTPDAVRAVADRVIDGLGELVRIESAQLTDKAWLSRTLVAVRGEQVIIALPGSLKAADECWEILSPHLPHLLHVVRGGQHG
jgi:molybdenum cofactor biosynthesis protein MoaC